MVAKDKKCHDGQYVCRPQLRGGESVCLSPAMSLRVETSSPPPGPPYSRRHARRSRRTIPTCCAAPHMRGSPGGRGRSINCQTHESMLEHEPPLPTLEVPRDAIRGEQGGGRLASRESILTGTVHSSRVRRATPPPGLTGRTRRLSLRDSPIDFMASRGRWLDEKRHDARVARGEGYSRARSNTGQ